MPTNYWHPFLEGCFYHIYSRSNNRETIFLNEVNYLFFLKKWDLLLSPYFETYSYAIIPNHFHFTVRVKPIDEDLIKNAQKEKTMASKKFLGGFESLDVFLEDQMKRFLTSYAKTFNLINDRSGSVFQKKFKRVLIKGEDHLTYMIAYHHHNPIHHRIAYGYDDWPYTSYKGIISNKNTKLKRKDVLDLFDPNDIGKARELFLEYHRNFKIEKGMEMLMLE